LAILGLARRFVKGSRKRVLFSAIEHKSVLATQSTLQALGYSVELIPVNRYGQVDLVALADMLDEHVLLASVMAVNNEIGTIQDSRNHFNDASQGGRHLPLRRCTGTLRHRYASNGQLGGHAQSFRTQDLRA